MATNTNITLAKKWHRAMDVNVLSEALTFTRNAGITVGATSTSVLVANTSRKTATFSNDSDEIIYLSLSPDARTAEGIRLAPAGTAGTHSYEINVTNLYNGAVSAICASGGKNLCITEGYGGSINSSTINSNGWVLKETSKTINSNSNLRELAQTVTINTNSFIKKLATTKTINSDGWVLYETSKTINSNSNLLKVTSKTINTNSFIKATSESPKNSNYNIKKLADEGSIDSDMFIGYQGQTKTINSDMFIGYYQDEGIWCRMVIIE